MEIAEKAKTFQKIKDIVEKNNINAFSMFDIQKETGIKYKAVKRCLTALEELEIIKYIESLKLYVKINNDIPSNISNIINLDAQKKGGQESDNLK